LRYFSDFAKYESISTLSPSEDPYQFWTGVGSHVPKLASVALQLLPAPATSSSCERDFSFTGVFTSSRKSQLSPENLNAKIILAANEELIELLDPIEQ
jgi:hypothetical protein